MKGLEGMADLAGMSGLLSGIKEKDKQHAEHIWEYLDDLKKDPEAYKKFMDEQKKNFEAEKKQQEKEEKLRVEEAKKILEDEFFIPGPAFVIYSSRTDQPEGSREVLYINICRSSQCPVMQLHDGTPASPSDPLGKVLIPLSVGTLVPIKEEEPNKSCDVVFHPETIQRCADAGFKFYVVELALQHIEEDHKLKLSRQYKELTGTNYKGKCPHPQRTEAYLNRLKKEVDKSEGRKQRKGGKGKRSKPKKKIDIVLPFGPKKPTEEDDGEGGIKELKLSKEKQGKKKPMIQIVGEENLDDGPTLSKSKPKPRGSTKSSVTQKQKTPSKKQIASSQSSDLRKGEEMFSNLSALLGGPSAPSSASSFSKSSTPTPSPQPLSQPSRTPQTPLYSLKCREGNVILIVELPEVSSVQEVTLDINSQSVELSSTNYSLKVRLPLKIDDAQASAKFSKKKRKLTVTAPQQAKA